MTSQPERPSRPPAALLVSAVLFWLSAVMAFGEWWLDRRGLDSVLAEMAVNSGNETVERGKLIEAGETARLEKSRFATNRKTTGISVVAGLFVISSVCGLKAWSRMKGNSYSRPAALLGSMACWQVFLTCQALTLTLVVAGFAPSYDPWTDPGSPGKTGGTQVIAGIVATSIFLWSAVRTLRQGYATLRPAASDTSVIPAPKWWLPLIAGTFVLAVTGLIGLARYLEGRKLEFYRPTAVSVRDQ